MKNAKDLVKHLISPYHIIVLILSLFLMGSALSCGIGLRTRALLGGKLTVSIDISEKANQNSPVALDVVVVYDEELLARLLEFSSKDWFEKREQIKRDYLQGEGLDYWGWEWVPGQKVTIQKLPLKPEAKGGFIFADYFSPGVHRVRIDPFGDVIVHLLEKRFTAESTD